MATNTETINQVKALARTFQSVIDMAAALERIDNLANAESEAQARIAALTVAGDAAQTSLNALHDAAANTIAQAERQAAATKANIAAVHAESVEYAEKRKADADIEAGAIVKEARAKAKAAEAKAQDAEEKVTAAEAELHALGMKIDAARGQISKMLAE